MRFSILVFNTWIYYDSKWFKSIILTHWHINYHHPFTTSNKASNKALPNLPASYCMIDDVLSIAGFACTDDRLWYRYGWRVCCISIFFWDVTWFWNLFHLSSTVFGRMTFWSVNLGIGTAKERSYCKSKC